MIGRERSCDIILVFVYLVCRDWVWIILTATSLIIHRKGPFVKHITLILGMDSYLINYARRDKHKQISLRIDTRLGSTEIREPNGQNAQYDTLQVTRVTRFWRSSNIYKIFSQKWTKPCQIFHIFLTLFQSCNRLRLSVTKLFERTNFHFLTFYQWL